jgi:hypothetical protein
VAVCIRDRADDDIDTRKVFAAVEYLLNDSAVPNFLKYLAGQAPRSGPGLHHYRRCHGRARAMAVSAAVTRSNPRSVSDGKIGSDRQRAK